MVLDFNQKKRYIESFEEDYIIDYLLSMINTDWELIYDPRPNDFEFKLIIAEEEYDRLAEEFAKEIIGD